MQNNDAALILNNLLDIQTWQTLPPPGDVYNLLVGLGLLAIFLMFYPNLRSTYYYFRRLFMGRGKRPMNDSERERQIIANLIVDVLEDGVYQEVISRRAANKAYARIGRLGYGDLLRKKHLYLKMFGKLHPYKIQQLKELLKSRVNGGPLKVPPHQGLLKLSEAEKSKRKLRLAS